MALRIETREISLEGIIKIFDYFCEINDFPAPQNYRIVLEEKSKELQTYSRFAWHIYLPRQAFFSLESEKNLVWVYASVRENEQKEKYEQLREKIKALFSGKTVYLE